MLVLTRPCPNTRYVRQAREESVDVAGVAQILKAAGTEAHGEFEIEGVAKHRCRIQSRIMRQL